MRLAQAMVGLIARSIQYSEPLLLRTRCCRIGIAIVQPQLNAGATPGYSLRICQQGVLIIGMIGMHHPVAAVAAQD